MTSLPFSLNSTGIAAYSCLLIAVIVYLVSFDLVREMFDHTAHGVGRRLAEPAYGCVSHRAGKFLEQRLIPPRRLHQVQRLGGADAARRALAARFFGEEFHQVARRPARLVAGRQDD